MKNISRKIGTYLKTLVIIFVMIFQGPSAAQAQSDPVTTAPGQITTLLSDWNANALLVSLGSNVPFINPNGCTLTDFYETNPTDAGIQLNNSILLSSYMNHSSLKLVIQGCSAGGRPRIIGITLSS